MRGGLEIAGQGRNAANHPVGPIEAEPRRQIGRRIAQGRVGRSHREGERLTEEGHRRNRTGERPWPWHRVGRKEPVAGNNLLGLAGAVPRQVRRRGARALEILHLDVVARAGLQRDGAHGIRSPLCLPVINDELVVHPQLHAVVRVRHEVVRLRVLRLDLAHPAHTIVAVVGNGICGVAPDKIHRGVYPHQLQVGTVEIEQAGVSGIGIGEIEAGEARAVWRGRGINHHARAIRAHHAVAGSGQHLVLGNDRGEQIRVGQRCERNIQRADAGGEYQCAGQGGVVQPFGRKTGAGAAKAQVHRDAVQREPAPGNRKLAWTGGKLPGIGLDRRRVGSRNRNHVLRAELAGHKRVVAQRVSIAIEMAVAVGVEGVQP